MARGGESDERVGGGRKRDTGQLVKMRRRLYLRMNKHIAMP